MYESLFGFTRRPFPSAPQADRYFGTTNSEHVRHTLIRCAELGQGPALLIGPAGTGKSLICDLLAEHFRQRYQVALLGSIHATNRRELLQAILFALHRPYKELSEGELQLSLIEHLQSSKQGLILIVDEAHLLGLKLLEELRVLSNLVDQGQPRVRLILSGNMSLEEKFAHPKLESFHQRVAARCYLQPLTYAETLDYVAQQIRVVGGDADTIVDESALQAIYQASGGVPRLINQVCDYALLLASLAGKTSLSAASIEEAWSELQQLPGPWQTSPSPAEASQMVIEFGSLDNATNTIHGPASPNRNHIEFTNSIELTMGSHEYHDHQIDDWSHEPSTIVTPTEHLLAQIEQGVADAFAAEHGRLHTNALAGRPGIHARGTSFPEISDPRYCVKSGQTCGGECHTDNPNVVVEIIQQHSHITIPVAANPFGDDFTEEIVVIDRFAALGNAVLRNRPQVTWSEGREWAEALTTAEIPSQPRTESTPLAANLPAPSAIDRDFHPANDPVLPEPVASSASIETLSIHSASRRETPARIADAPKSTTTAAIAKNKTASNTVGLHTAAQNTATSGVVTTPAATIALSRSIDLVPAKTKTRTVAQTAPIADAVASIGDLLAITEESIAALATPVRLIEISTDTPDRNMVNPFPTASTQVNSQIEPGLETLTQSITISGITENLEPPVRKEPAILPTDDRDLLVIHDESTDTLDGSHGPTGRVRRYAYRQLFSRLRRR
ncbi:MAG: hypothetical protein RIS70_707 [Planctomycetota bacterium]